jgi:hypothetical protein
MGARKSPRISEMLDFVRAGEYRTLRSRRVVPVQINVAHQQVNIAKGEE